MATAKAPKKADVKEEKGDAKKEAKSPKEDKKVIQRLYKEIRN